MIHLAQKTLLSLATEAVGMAARTTTKTVSTGITGYLSQYWLALIIFFAAGFIVGFGFRFIKWGV